MKQQIYVFFIFLMPFVLFAWDYQVLETNRPGQERLKKALNATKEVDYISTITPCNFPEFPKCDKAIFFRHCQPEKNVLNIRLDLYEKETVRFSFIKNEEGQFAIDHKNSLTLKGEDFLRIFYLEALSNSFFDVEIMYSDYSVSKATYQKRACTKIIQSIPKEIENDQSFLLGFTEHATCKNLDDYRTKHPFRRVFLIDNKTNCIVERKHYNGNRKCIFHLNLGEMVFTPNWNDYPDVFKSPQKITGTILDEEDFLRLVYDADRLSNDKTGTGNRTTGIMQKMFGPAWKDNILRWSGYLALAIGCFCLIAIVLLRRRH